MPGLAGKQAVATSLWFGTLGHCSRSEGTGSDRSPNTRHLSPAQSSDSEGFFPSGQPLCSDASKSCAAPIPHWLEVTDSKLCVFSRKEMHFKNVCTYYIGFDTQEWWLGQAKAFLKATLNNFLFPGCESSDKHLLF